MSERLKKVVTFDDVLKVIRMTSKENELMFQFLGMVFPKDLLTYFELTGFEDNEIPESERLGVESGELIVHLEERDSFRHPEEGHTYRSNGFYEASKVRDFPLRDKKLTLLLKRRRWIDETTGKSVSNTYELVAEGTRHSVEFAAFLKECFGQIPDISIFA